MTDTPRATKIQALITALVNKFEEKANKVTSWSGTPSDANYPSEKLVKDTLDTKQTTANKVTAWQSTTSDDKYPSEKLVKDSLDLKENGVNKVSAWSNETNNTHYPTEKLVKDSLDLKADADDIPTKVSDLDNDSGFLTAHQSLSDIGGAVTVTKQQTAETGYVATYVIAQGGTDLSTKINIPKDYLVKSGEVKTAAAADLTTLGNGYTAGDKYIDFVINTKNNDGTDEHIYINVKDLVEDTTYTADGTTLTLTNGEFAIKSAGVDTTQIKDSAVTTAKINDSAVTTAKINDGAVTEAKLDSTFKASLLTLANVDSEIESYIEDLTTALTPVSGDD